MNKRSGWGTGLAMVLVAAGTACIDDAPEREDTSAAEMAATTGPPGTTQTTLFDRRSYWSYHDGSALTGTAWRNNYSWDCGGCLQAVGQAPLGYGESYLATTLSYGDNAATKHPTAYFRTNFAVPDGVRALFLRVMYDDGFVFYLNGKEGGRASMPAGTITASTLASGHEAENRYVTFDVSAQIPRLVAGGNNWLAAEVHQASASSSDLVFDAELIAWIDEPMDVTTREGIPRASYWHLWDAAGAPADWRSPDLDDSEWSAGPAPLGYGESYLGTTTASGSITTYFRKQLTIEGSVHGLAADVMYDDGFVAYLNGTEIQRAGMPAGAVTASTAATGHEAAGYQRFDWDAAVPLLVDGENTLAVEVHQSSASSSDLVFDLGLEVLGAWSLQDSGTTHELNDVASLDAARAWVVGWNGTILRTVDSGATWSPQASGTTSELTAIEFVDGHGWIVGDDGTVLHSGDGGATWAPQGSLGGRFADVAFVSAATGWIAGGNDAGVRVARTDDGGATWTPQPIDADFVSAIDFIDADHGWALGLSTTWGWEALYYTDDGGATWTERWDAGGFYARIGDFGAIDADTVLIVGGSSVHSDGGERKLLSRDAGLTWESLPSTSNPLALLAVDFVGEQGWAIGAGTSIIHTDDAAETWTVQQVGRYRDEGRIIGEGPYYKAIHVASDGLHGWAVGSGGTILSTSTGGR